MSSRLRILAAICCVVSIRCAERRGSEPEARRSEPEARRGQTPGAPGVHALAALPGGFTVSRLSDSAFAITTQPYSANSLVVHTASGATILVDSPSTPADTEVILDWIERSFGKAPVAAITSHWHNDASAGNQVLTARRIEVISSARTAKMLRERGAELRSGLIAHFAERDPATAEELEDLRPTPATRTLEIVDSVDLTIAGEPVRLVYPGPSHSADSIGVLFPARGLFYGGCAVRSDGRVVNRREADFESWPRALETFAALRPRVVVPGHGRRFDPEMIAESIAAVRAAAR